MHPRFVFDLAPGSGTAEKKIQRSRAARTGFGVESFDVSPDMCRGITTLLID